VIPLILNVTSIGWSVYSTFEVLLMGTFSNQHCIFCPSGVPGLVSIED
jgi:hypothetical protein